MVGVIVTCPPELDDGTAIVSAGETTFMEVGAPVGGSRVTVGSASVGVGTTTLLGAGKVTDGGVTEGVVGDGAVGKSGNRTLGTSSSALNWQLRNTVMPKATSSILLRLVIL